MIKKLQIVRSIKTSCDILGIVCPDLSNMEILELSRLNTKLKEHVSEFQLRNIR